MHNPSLTEGLPFPMGRGRCVCSGCPQDDSSPSIRSSSELEVWKRWLWRGKDWRLDEDGAGEGDTENFACNSYKCPN